jgi:peptide-methionine (R)-S-oxide reductase
MNEENWKKKLTKDQYRVLRDKGTEVPYSSNLNDKFEKGEYACAGCGNVIFDSNFKYKSDCGWPSFWDANPGSVKFNEDKSFGMKRIEVVCSKCGGHLGHVFEDGPKEHGGMRFCINGVALGFMKK